MDDSPDARPPGPSRRAQCAGLGFCILVLGSNVYRAATQSLTHDEAITYLEFVRNGWRSTFGGYLPNNHVLHSLFAVLTTSLFGHTQMALRLPSVIAGALYLGLVFDFLRRLTRRDTTFLLGLCLLALDPYVLDFLSAARGYGIALAFSLIALRLVQGAVMGERRSGRRLAGAGLACGLAIATVPTYVYFTFALAVAAAIARAHPRSKASDRARSMAAAFGVIVLVAAIVAAPILLPPLRYADKSTFSIGTPSVAESVGSIARGLARPGGSLSSAIPGPVATAAAHALRAVLFAGFGGLVIGAWIARRRALGDGGARADDALILLAGVLILVEALLHGLAHAAFGILYPLPRTALDMLVWWSLGVVALAARLERGSPVAALASRALNALMAAMVALFLLVFDVHRYRDWAFDADTRAVYLELEREFGTRSEVRPLKVGSHWLLAPALNAYRAMRNGGWMSPVKVEDVPAEPYEIYVVMPGRDELAVRMYLDVRRTFPLAGTMLAVPK